MLASGTRLTSRTTSILRFQDSRRVPTNLHRKFWTPSRISNPPPATAAYLVIQGFFIVVGADYAVNTLLSQPAITTTILRSFHILSTPPQFTDVHSIAQDGLHQVPKDAESDQARHA